MTIYDSVKKAKVEFKPQNSDEVLIYVCGPTVYDDAHLGHARSAIAFDMLRRVLKVDGYNVTFVKNITDVDDKILKKMSDDNRTLEELTEYYSNSYHEDMDALNVLSPDIEPKATKSIDAMKDLITTLLEKEYAYKTDNGDVYFDTSKDDDYLSISKRSFEYETQSRIEKNSNKKNSADFALWKNCNKDEAVCFDSNFGSGRPGWHTECSAMIEKHLARDSYEYAIDIHGGGADLLFPHHENEAAQTRCATDHKLAKYWMHNGFVTINGEKMSKSLGNSFFLKDALKHYHGEVLRYYLCTTNYRQDLSFNEEDLKNSKKRLDRIFRLKKRLLSIAPAKNANIEFIKSMKDAMNDDMNSSVALASIDEMIANANELLDSNMSKNEKKEVVANLDFINELLGFGKIDAYEYFQFGIDDKLKERIENLIMLRDNAKREKDYALADSLRDDIKKLNISIMDTPNGTVWEKL